MLQPRDVVGQQADGGVRTLQVDMLVVVVVVVVLCPSFTGCLRNNMQTVRRLYVRLGSSSLVLRAVWDGRAPPGVGCWWSPGSPLSQRNGPKGRPADSSSVAGLIGDLESGVL